MCIGTLPQRNDWSGSWSEFWWQCRLAPQLELAASCFDLAALRHFEALRARLPVLLEPGQQEGASLLHGDLWRGNVVLSDADAAVVDPSCYYGHREVDLAMAALFGGFPPAFFTAYEGLWPVAPGFEERRAAYQLYYLLVHVNLFGTGYVPRTCAALGRALSR